MAFTPCDVHGRMYKGGASTFFFAIVDGRDRSNRRAQLCSDCATITLDDLAAHLLKVSEGDNFFEVTEPKLCNLCGEAPDNKSRKLFVNAYPRGKAETQWYGAVCHKCATEFAEKWELG